MCNPESNPEPLRSLRFLPVLLQFYYSVSYEMSQITKIVLMLITEIPNPHL